MKEKVVIIVNGGVVHLESKPKDLIIEIRDYDSEGVDPGVLTKDEENDEYQKIIL